MSSTIAQLAIIISLLALWVSFLSYRHATRPRVETRWKAYRRFHRGEGLYCFFETMFTNTGGKSVSLIELTSSDERLVFIDQIDPSDPLHESARTPYKDQARLFLLSKPMQWYLSDDKIRTIKQETELILSDDISMNVPIAAGTTYRLTLCFEFPNHEPITKHGTALFVRFRCMFNNGQSSAVGGAVDGHPIYVSLGDQNLT